MSKARELLINSRLMKKNENEEQKIFNKVNPSSDLLCVGNTSCELAEKSNYLIYQ
jgi:hypothetical protein